MDYVNLNQPTLRDFENERSKNNYTPLKGSNSFFKIGDGEINLYTIDSDKLSFDLSTNQGIVNTGTNFTVRADNSDVPYRSLSVIANTQLSVTASTRENINRLTIYGNPDPSYDAATMSVHGVFELNQYTEIFIRNNAHLVLHADSTFIVHDNSNIIVEKGSSITIYGQINIHLSKVDSILNADGIVLDPAAVMNVDGIDKTNRPYSMCDYETDLRDRVININTQGETNSEYGRMGYSWTGGSPANFSQVIMMSVLWGESILGDFKLSALGLPSSDISNSQIVSDIKVSSDATLYIQEKYKNKKYIRPELYIGVIINNNSRPGNLIIDGTVICDGKNSMITLDRGGAVHINRTGTLILQNDAIMRSTHNDGRVLFIDGTLIIDSTSQIESFSKDNILFGENGRVIIRNPNSGTKRILFSTPNGICKSTLYKLFEDTIDHIEYHISKNTGIRIDQYYDFYSRDMKKWFGNRRIEKAIHDGILVWDDGGFIELDQSIIPWVSKGSNLFQAAKLFKSFSADNKERLQEVADRLRYAGAGNIIFRFISGSRIKEVTLTLDSVEMKSVVNKPASNIYSLTTNNSGELFLRNKYNVLSSSDIVNKKSKMIPIPEDHIDFKL